MQEIIIKRSRLLLLFVALGCFGFVAMIYSSYNNPDNIPTLYSIVMSWIGIIFFGGIGGAYVIYSIVLIIRGRYDIVINSQGVYDYSTLASRPVLWHEVALIELLNQKTSIDRHATANVEYVRVAIRDEYKDAPSLGVIRRAVIAMNRAAGYEGIFIPIKGAKMPPEQIVDIMRQYHQRSVAATSASPSPVLPNN